MKRTLPFLIIVVILVFTQLTTKAQTYHFKEGFGSTPVGWILSNTFLSSTAEFQHNEYDGIKSVKMKGIESSIQTLSYETAGELVYWVRPMISGSKIKVEKSKDQGVTWIELETYSPIDNELSVYQKRAIKINDSSIAFMVKFPATGGNDQDGLMYLDDVSLTTYNAPTSVSKFIKSGISCYPNPVSDLLHIQSKNTEVESVSIVNSSGQKVYHAENPGKELSIDVSELSKGIYMANIKSNEGTSILKIIKE